MEARTAAGTQMCFPDTLVTVRVDHDEGRDGISVLERRAPHADSPPLRVHHTEDEAFYVLEGELRIRAAHAEFRIGSGEAALAGSVVPHTYRVESREGARWLNVTTHRDYVRVVAAVSHQAVRPELPTPQGPPTPEQPEALATTAREHRIEFVALPLAS
jgi:mannose-6-phosphate isomerase-like protein (cupin superfamily)